MHLKNNLDHLLVEMKQIGPQKFTLNIGYLAILGCGNKTSIVSHRQIMISDHCHEMVIFYCEECHIYRKLSLNLAFQLEELS